MKHYAYKIKPVSDLIEYINNARTHTDEQINQVASSIKEFGITNPVLIDEQGGIVAGHCRVQAMQKLGINETPCIVLTGLTEAQKKAYVIADNQLALNAGWDIDLLKLEIESLQEVDFDLELLGFDDDFLTDLIADEEESENPYTMKIEAPTYEPSEEKPALSELINTEKTDQLVTNIQAANLDKATTDFLVHAAQRHTVFTFDKIADYYAHSAPEIQAIMEESALVIIDFDKALENGFVQIRDKIQAQYEAENA